MKDLKLAVTDAEHSAANISLLDGRRAVVATHTIHQSGTLVIYEPIMNASTLLGSSLALLIGVN